MYLESDFLYVKKCKKVLCAHTFTFLNLIKY